jgi:hypothetical protein
MFILLNIAPGRSLSITASLELDETMHLSRSIRELHIFICARYTTLLFMKLFLEVIIDEWNPVPKFGDL